MLRFVNARNDKKRLNEIKSLYDEAFPKEDRFPSDFEKSRPHINSRSDAGI